MLNLKRGDTIIEVLLAFTVFSLVSVGAMTVMSQGTNAAQRALEITLVRQQIDAQAEALRAAQQAFTRSANPASSEWNKFAISGSVNDSTHFAETGRCPVPAEMNNNATRTFIMNPKTAAATMTGTWYGDINDSTDYPYAKIGTDGRAYGIWIERTYKAGTVNTPDSYDFDVRACWYGAGMDIPLQIETSVRLYEPRT